MNMRELAALAGVSVSTVSKAFSGSREISGAQREKIFEIARAHNCYEKYNKEQFDKPVIAVIGPEFQSHYYGQQLSLMDAQIQKHGGIMLTGCHNFDADTAAGLIRYFSKYVQVQGMIVCKEHVPIDATDVPMVVIGSSEVYDSISLSWTAAMEESVELFLQNGHKRIAFIGDNLTNVKQKTFIESVKKRGMGLPQEYVLIGKKRFEEAGYAEMNALLSLPEPPTAVVAGYDAIAIGAMKSISEHGLKIPQDISLIGMDDMSINPYLDTALTSITSYNADLCEIAVDMLFERIANPAQEKKTVKVSGQLVHRDSVGKAK